MEKFVFPAFWFWYDGRWVNIECLEIQRVEKEVESRLGV